jgi:uncharacterized damage-inducible protein DinB
MNDTLRYLSRHNVWASRTLLDRCRTLTAEQLAAPAVASYGTIIETLRHLVMSDAGYLSALGGPQTSWLADYQRALDAAPEPWHEGPMEDGDLDELERRIDETEPLWDAFLSQTEFDAEHVSVLDRGTYECPAGIVMAQVFHHGSVHREQVCAMLTALGVEPPDIQPWAFADATGVSRLRGSRTSY